MKIKIVALLCTLSLSSAFAAKPSEPLSPGQGLNRPHRFQQLLNVTASVNNPEPVSSSALIAKSTRDQAIQTDVPSLATPLGRQEATTLFTRHLEFINTGLLISDPAANPTLFTNIKCQGKAKELKALMQKITLLPYATAPTDTYDPAYKIKLFFPVVGLNNLKEKANKGDGESKRLLEILYPCLAAPVRTPIKITKESTRLENMGFLEEAFYHTKHKDEAGWTRKHRCYRIPKHVHEELNWPSRNHLDLDHIQSTPPPKTLSEA